ncbi:hypothetical protein [Pectobacterium zantedeschiae]|uniref:Phage-related protein n=1 Tax=Pectobacterium zantedeschiae TaxID=2034769 RepID=A0A9X8P5N1_9GAMM|nr:hypothetical protein [Pectobacterium zantedeschiae]RYC44636.1 hypothetical protein CLR69_06360 [Pectobacterium zantedeschiae]RYC49793.1 hypothetical protein CTN06_02165 [Pectobacterium zantedeschiae]
MKERGIIFNGEMVRATLDGLKTQTRRVVRHQPDEDGLARLSGGPWMDTSEKVYRCPYGEVGDRLWVRETSGLQVRRDALGGTGEFRVYRASNPDAIRFTANGKNYPIKWVPSIHMPRHASRITLEITDVRVERLNYISEEDAISEGVARRHSDTYHGFYRDYENQGYGCGCTFAKDSFRSLWRSIYGAESWNANPWCWAITFKRIEGA